MPTLEDKEPEPDSDEEKEESEGEIDPMKALEQRMEESQREMEVMDALQDIRTRIHSIGNVSEMQATINMLAGIHGQGGDEERRQTFSRAGMHDLNTSVTVGSHNLEKAKPKND